MPEPLASANTPIGVVEFLDHFAESVRRDGRVALTLGGLNLVGGIFDHVVGWASRGQPSAPFAQMPRAIGASIVAWLISVLVDAAVGVRVIRGTSAGAALGVAIRRAVPLVIASTIGLIAWVFGCACFVLPLFVVSAFLCPVSALIVVFDHGVIDAMGRSIELVGRTFVPTLFATAGILFLILFVMGADAGVSFLLDAERSVVPGIVRSIVLVPLMALYSLVGPTLLRIRLRETAVDASKVANVFA